MTDTPPAPLFTAPQRRIIGNAAAFLSLAALLVGASLLVWLGLKSLGYLLHIVGPVIVAFFLSLLTRPLYDWLKTRIRNVTGTVVVFLAIFFVPIVLVCWFFGAFLVEQGNNLSHILPAVIDKSRTLLTETFPEAKETIQEMMPNLSQVLTADGSVSWAKLADMAGRGLQMGGKVFSAGSSALLWLLTFFYWIAFIIQEPLDGKKFAACLPFLNEGGREAVAAHFKRFVEIMVVYFRGQTLDVLVQGLLYGTAFQIIGLPNGFIIGFTAGLLNLMPYLGVLAAIVVALPIAYFHGGGGLLAVTAAIICAIQTFDGYAMQPFIQGDRMKLAAWQIVFALLFWTRLGGFLGLLLAIPLTAFIKASWGGWRETSSRLAGAEAKKAKADAGAPTEDAAHE